MVNLTNRYAGKCKGSRELFDACGSAVSPREGIFYRGRVVCKGCACEAFQEAHRAAAGNRLVKWISRQKLPRGWKTNSEFHWFLPAPGIS